MKHRAPRALASAVTAALLAVLIVAGGPTGPAAAATIPVVDPTLPVGPLNSLPSTLTGAVKKLPTGVPAADNVLAQAYGLFRTPEFWAAVRAQQNGTATAAQQAAIAAAPKPAVPVTALSPLSKAAGGATAAFTAYQFGAMATAGVLDLAGTDANGTVCRFAGPNGLVGQAVAFAAGQTCSPNGPGSSYVVNTDGVGGFQGGSSCNARGECAELFSQVRERITDAVDRIYSCFRVTGTNNARTQISYGGSEVGFPNIGGVLDRAGSYGQACVSGGGDIFYTYRLSNDPKGQLVSWFLVRGDGTAPQRATIGQGNPNPMRGLMTTIRGTDGLTYTATSPGYTEADTEWARPEMPLLPDGVGVESMTVTETGGPSPVEVYNEPATPEYQYLRQLAPECASGTCLLDLQKTGVSCFQQPGPCADWYADPNKASTYKCTYGGHDVALAECTVYAPTFKPEAKTSGAPLGNPTTGEPMINPNPTPGIGTSVSPSTGKQENCLANGWASAPNPIEWVMVPVKCAIQWAFVPRPEVVSGKLDTIKKSWQATTPGAVVTAMSGFALTAPASSCSGITVPMGWLMGIPDMKVFNACPGELMAPIAGVSKLVFYVIFTVVGIGGVTSNVGRIFGYRGVGAE